MKIWQKLVIIPVLAASGFVAMLAVNLTWGGRGAERLRHISQAMASAEEIKHIVNEIQQGLEKAASVRDSSALASLVEQRNVLAEILERAVANPIVPREAYEALRDAHDEYYSLAERVIMALDEAGPTDLDVGTSAELSSVPQLTMRLQYALDAALMETSASVKGAFLASGQMRDELTRLNAVLAMVCLLAIIALASSLVLSFTRTLRKVSRGFDRMAGGDFAEQVYVDTGDELGALARQVNRMGDYLREMASVAGDIAGGDLRVRVTPRSERDSFAMAFARMVHSLCEVVAQVRDSVSEINTASVEMIASSRQHEKGASEQAATVEEALRTIQQLLESNHQILEAAQSVLDTAEMTHKSNQLVAERIGTLTSHTEGIAEILLAIKDIANKSELLALNAGLEGIKAGEAGRGFSLVAGEMQRLAESVMSAVDRIKTITSDIREASHGSVLATEEGTKLARDTTSSAERIGLIIQQQKYAMENVSNAMSDVSRVARDIATGATQSLQSLRSLKEHAERQTSLIDRFQIMTSNGPIGEKEQAVGQTSEGLS